MTDASYDRVTEVFNRALDLPAADRAAFVHAECADNTAVRERVLKMLDYGADADALCFDGIAEQVLCDAFPPTAAGDDVAPDIPDRIGEYRIIRKIAEGGMGSVYEAAQEHPQRTVALKTLRDGLRSPGLMRRFEREIRLLARLNHPRIAQVLDAGTAETPAGRIPYFTMEFIEGRSIVDAAEAADMTTRERLMLIADVCDAVQYAHLRGVIHRDLKPANILVRTDDSSGPQVKVLDFGVARAIETDDPVTHHTDVGQLIGTLPYMSPEQVTQASSELDTRTDVYSIGVVMYELLTATLPLDVGSRSLPEAIRMICQDEPRRLPGAHRSLRGEVETIVAKALEKDPARRYSSVSELAADIRRHLADEPISARPASMLYQVRKFARRNRPLVGGIIAAVLALVVGLIGTLLFAIRASEREFDAIDQSYRANITAANALAATDPRTAREHLDDCPIDQRAWEWHHLRARLDSATLVYEGSAPAIGEVALASDGARLVGALEDHTLAIWDVETAALRRSIDIGDEIIEIAMPSDGPPRVAVSTADGRVLVIDIDSDERRVIVGPQEGVARGVRWDRAGRSLGFVQQRRLIVTTDDKRREFGTLRGAANWTFSPDGTTILAISDDSRQCVLHNVATGEVIRHGLVDHDDVPQVIEYAADGSHYYVGTLQRSINVHDARTLEETARHDGHGRSLVAIAVSPDSRSVATSSLDGTIRLRDAATGTLSAVLIADLLTQVVFTSDGNGLIFKQGENLRRWDRSSGSRTLAGHANFLYFLCFSPDGTRLAAATPFPPYEAVVWDVESERRIATLPLGRNVFSGGSSDWTFAGRNALLAFTPDNESLVGRNSVHDIRSGAITPTVGTDTAQGRYPSGVVSPDGSIIVHLPARSGGVRVRDTDTDEVRFDVEGGSYTGAAFSPDGRLLALTRGRTGRPAEVERTSIEIRDTRDGALIVELPGHFGRTFAVDFHPDGSRLASGGEDNTVRIWDTRTWRQMIELRGHTSYVKAVRFSPDGTRLASASGDFTVRIWDTIPLHQRMGGTP